MLRIIRELFNEFKVENINYCHWKSNEHINDGLNGVTDLDILIDKNKIAKVKEVLYKHNIKRYDSTFYLDYNSIEDFIGFDDDTGKMIHIHLHYQLKLGRKFIKEIHLPIEQYIFKNAVIEDKETGFSILNPNMEIILLVIRYIVKNKNRRISLNKGNFLTNDYLKEFEWLKKQIDFDKIKNHCEILFNKEFAFLLIEFIKDSSNRKYYSLLKVETLKMLRFYYNSNTIIQNLNYFQYRVQAVYRYIQVKKMNKPIPFKRVNSHGGLIIVFVGVDGSGKSTMIKEVKKWLSWKLDIHEVYFGSGDGKSSVLRLPLVLLVNLIKRPKLKNKKISSNNENEITNSTKIRKSLVFRTFKVAWAISLAIEKDIKFKKLWKAKSNGLIVISDRYPQTDIMSYNDGPLLSSWLESNNKVKKKIGEWEYNIYKLSKIYNPDLVFKLKISPELSFKRKPETPFKMIQKKIDAVEKMKFNDNTNVVEVDTSKSVEEALYEIKKAISELL